MRWSRPRKCVKTDAAAPMPGARRHGCRSVTISSRPISRFHIAGWHIPRRGPLRRGRRGSSVHPAANGDLLDRHAFVPMRPRELPGIRSRSLLDARPRSGYALPASRTQRRFLIQIDASRHDFRAAADQRREKPPFHPFDRRRHRPSPGQELVRCDICLARSRPAPHASGERWLLPPRRATAALSFCRSPLRREQRQRCSRFLFRFRLFWFLSFAV